MHAKDKVIFKFQFIYFVGYFLTVLCLNTNIKLKNRKYTSVKVSVNGSMFLPTWSIASGHKSQVQLTNSVKTSDLEGKLLFSFLAPCL